MRPLYLLALAASAVPLTAFAADPYSYAQPDQVRVTHLHLDLAIDFPPRRLDGQATLTLPLTQQAVEEILAKTSAAKK